MQHNEASQSSARRESLTYRLFGAAVTHRALAAINFFSGILIAVVAAFIAPGSLPFFFMVSYFWMTWRWKQMSPEQLIALGMSLALLHVLWIGAMRYVAVTTKPDAQGGAFLGLYLLAAFAITEILTVLACLRLGARMNFCETIEGA